MKSFNLRFAKTYEIDGKVYDSGKVYPIADTPGSIERWLRRGCVIVEDQKVEVKKVEEVKEPVKKVVKKVLKKSSFKSKK